MFVYLSNSAEYHSRVILSYDTVKTLRVFINQTDDLTEIKRDIIQILAYNTITSMHKGDGLSELVLREIVPIFESKLAYRSPHMGPIMGPSAPISADPLSGSTAGPSTDINDEKNLFMDLNSILNTVDQSRLRIDTNSLLKRVGGILTNQLKPIGPQQVSFITKRNRLSVEAINMLAESIKKRITEQKIKHPDFNGKIKSKYRKIKNFVHNLTQIWLSYDEMLIFIHKINENLQ